jgi:flavin-dependent dehydrogenase
MESCDVIIAGGGPAGSACAWKLRQQGVDVVVVDRAAFPRDKVCAGWITPQVVTDLRIDVDDYGQGRTIQAITGFRTGIIGREKEIETVYDRIVSFGIRRCEFDDYLLARSGARLKVGVPVSSIRRENSRWIVNGELQAPILVGAGGHFCPVAKWLNPPNGSRRHDSGKLVAAQETEFEVGQEEARSFTTPPERPQLYFCPDLKGYGWCFRKAEHLNIGFGRLGPSALPKACADFVSFLQRKGIVPSGTSLRWRGHAYLLHPSPRRHMVDDGVLLVGDSAGLAYPQSGEGIRPAVESGLLAAETIVDAGGRSERDWLKPYEKRLDERFGEGSVARTLSRLAELAVPKSLAASALEIPGFVRHVVLDRWFLHAADPPLALS